MEDSSISLLIKNDILEFHRASRVSVSPMEEYLHRRE